MSMLSVVDDEDDEPPPSSSSPPPSQLDCPSLRLSLSMFFRRLSSNSFEGPSEEGVHDDRFSESSLGAFSPRR